MSEYVFGIDLGTTTTIISLIRDGIPEVIPVEDGRTFLIPSVVHFNESGDPDLVGTEAKKKRVYDPEGTVFSIKRIIGRTFSHPDTEVAMLRFPYTLVKGENDSVLVEMHEKHYSPPEISALVLKRAMAFAEKYTGSPVNKAVITVPANFNEAQRRATQNAGKLAGLEVLRIINEPTAAALAYGFGSAVNQKVAVYDFGGGTFDITILDVKDQLLDVLSTEGNSFLGGDDIDNALLEYLVADIEKRYKIRVMDHPRIITTLLSESEKIKIALSDRTEIKAILRGLIPDGDKRHDYTIELSKETFNAIAVPVIKKTFVICDQALKNAHLKTGDIDAVILVGGSTKVPLVEEEVRKYFGKDPCLGIKTELVVSMGAAILASNLDQRFNEDTPVLLDVTPLAIGVGTVGDHIEILIDKNETLPIERTEIFTNAVENQEEVRVRIFQGDSNKKSEALLMGELILSELRKAPRGMLKIEVKFELDTNGVLNVSALDIDTCKQQKIALNILGLSVEDRELRAVLDEVEKEHQR